jgi:paraquat-inducible protein A
VPILAMAVPHDSASVLHECPGCGRFQIVPPLQAHELARCDRCRVTLRRGHSDPLNHATALAFAALVLLLIATVRTMMTVQTAGISHRADLFGGPVELLARGLWPLAVVVTFTTVVAPFLLLGGTLYVLLMLRLEHPPRHLRGVYKTVRWLAPWSMIEVLLLGAFVAYVKLQDLVQIGVGEALVALVVLTFVMTWLASVLDANTIWEEMQRRGVVGPDGDGAATAMPRQADAVSCHGCGLVQSADSGGECLRCRAPLHRRKPNSIARTWALCLAAVVLYIPANYYPVLTVVQLGAGAPSTILGGVRELIEAQMWPLAALVFMASVAIPMLKLVGLGIMLVCVQTGAAARLRERTMLYGFVLRIGRWSMVDIFMESLLGALVQFGRVVTIEPGVGAVAFCAVVILTMFAAESFDPRLMWDAAETRDPQDVAAEAEAA